MRATQLENTDKLEKIIILKLKNFESKNEKIEMFVQATYIEPEIDSAGDRSTASPETLKRVRKRIEENPARASALVVRSPPTTRSTMSSNKL